MVRERAHIPPADVALALAEHERDCWEREDGPVYRLRRELGEVRRQLARWGGAIALALILLTAAVVIAPWTLSSVVRAEVLRMKSDIISVAQAKSQP